MEGGEGQGWREERERDGGREWEVGEKIREGNEYREDLRESYGHRGMDQEM